MLDPQQAFRIGFLLRCADEALDGAAAGQRLHRAEALLKRAGWLGDTLQAGQNAGSAAVTLGLLAPVALGGLGGALAHKAVEDDVDADDVRTREIINELRHWTRRAQSHRRHKRESEVS